MKNFKKAICIVSSAVLSADIIALNTLPVFAGEMLGQTDFAGGIGLPWHVCESGPAKMDFEIDNNEYRITINNPGGAERGGESKWDCQFRHRGLTIRPGNSYSVAFTVKASNAGRIYAKIGNLDGTREYWNDAGGGEWQFIQIPANEWITVEKTFTPRTDGGNGLNGVDGAAEWAFQFGGKGEYNEQGDCFPVGTVLTFKNMSLKNLTSNEDDWKGEPPHERKEILLNQLGYYLTLSKKATLVSSSKTPVDFEIFDSSNSSVYKGKSIPKGKESDSGDDVHILDFSDFVVQGTGFTIKSGSASSHPFDIINDGNLYTNVLYDSLKYFYLNRSGIPIEQQYTPTPELARPAGHSPDKAKTEVITESASAKWDFPTAIDIDVTGGWYDAGDFGKYVVNGGISVWTLQNLYEHAVKRTQTHLPMYADGVMNIPESGNGFPDVLDEARYELEFMFKMVVPSTAPKYQGMVFHKMHDEKWTGLAIAPAEDTESVRIIKPPTTAATLNLAAVAAQGYRVWKDIDVTFAEKCLQEAKSAYEAAKKYPDRFAPLDQAIGGGPYGDDYVGDEFYWAACELYLATNDNTYLSDMKSSKHYLEVPAVLGQGEEVDTVGSFNWGNTAALGSLSLSLYEDDVMQNIVKTADTYLEIIAKQGYGIPLEQCTLGIANNIRGYPWGSNSFVANNAIVLAYAYDWTSDGKYISGVAESMDYLMGRNPLDYSYVTGYGTHYAQYPHHRFWSNQIDSSFPLAPSGVLVGGPNSAMQDPWVRGSGWKIGTKSPQTCYLDHVEAWSVNECTINWNSPLAWVTGFLTENLADIANVKIGGTGGGKAIDKDGNEITPPSSGDPADKITTTKPVKPISLVSDSKEKIILTLTIVLTLIMAVETVVVVKIRKKQW
jgi:endoglucanase